MIEPTFDADGYPTEETLAAIKNWNVVNDGPYELVEFLHKAWHFAGWGWLMKPIRRGMSKGHHKLYISTGGWSGNESLIGALQENGMFMAMFWVSSTRGGHYEFDLWKPDKPEESQP